MKYLSELPDANINLLSDPIKSLSIVNRISPQVMKLFLHHYLKYPLLHHVYILLMGAI